jgi:hypothetical protein
MAALHLRLRKEVSDLPREHVFLHGGRYALSFIEVSRLWDMREGKPELSFISSSYAPLNGVSKDRAKDLLLEEICEYLPIAPEDVESWELNTNTDVPLFINTIGAWPNRPRPKQKIKNLYLAGDYVRNAIDLACMEGAVSAALEAAAHMLQDRGATESLPSAQVPPVWPRGLLVLARVLLIPIVAVARAIAWLEEQVSPGRHRVAKARASVEAKLVKKVSAARTP